MCGRYTITPGIQGLLNELGLTGPADDYGSRYNVAPSQEVPVLRESEAGEKEVVLMRWGLIPSWARDPAIGNRMINARSETVAEKPSFRVAFARRRVIVLADGWYEWMKTGTGKQPIRITLGGDGVFGFAGLWEWWTRKEDRGESEKGPDAGILSCTIITTAAAPLIKKIHPRMPCVLRRREWDAWLDPLAGREMLQAMLGPYPGDDLKAYPVSTAVNSPRNDRSEVIEPAGAPLDLEENSAPRV